MTPYQNILQNISRFITLTPEEAALFSEVLSIKKLKRKELLLREGNVCTAEYFVNKGCLREYYVDHKGMEHNLYFAIEDWWISDLHSRTQSAPSYCNIVALEDSELVAIDHDNLEQCILKIPALERFFRLSYERSLAGQHLRNVQMLSMSAEARYIQFLERYPKLAGRIPQKHIATFLGLTPEFFNTVHAKVIRSMDKKGK